MSTSETIPTTYRGYRIEIETDKWRHKRGHFVTFSKGDSIDCDPGFQFWAENINEAKELIDDLIAEKETPEPPSSPLSISGDKHAIQVLQYGMKFYSDWLEDICKKNPIMYTELKELREQTQKCLTAIAKHQVFGSDTVGETKD